MYIRRAIDMELINWKNSVTRKPLLLRGARQVGKSSAIRNLGKSFTHFIEINFDEKKEWTTLFESTQNFDEFLDLHQPIKGDVVYLDPPYVPLSSTASFTSYAKAGFGTDEQKHLAKVINRLVENDVSVILSNSYTDLTMDIFAGTGLRFFKVSMMRSIAAKAQSRNSVYEVLATNISITHLPGNMEKVS
jgi:site-specific DNA-adenine methylase